MGVLESVLQFKELERQREMADISAIGNAVNTFVQAKQLAQQQAEDRRFRELQMRNIESQIQAREKPDLVEQFSQNKTLLDVAKATNNIELGRFAVGNINSLLGQATQPSVEQPKQDLTRFDIKPGGVSPEQISSGVASADKVELQRQAAETDILGRPTPEAAEAQSSLDLIKKQEEAEITIGKEVKSKEAKDVLTARQDLTNIGLKSQALFDEFVNVASKSKEVIGADPGPVSGLWSQLIGGTFRINEFIPAFRGGQIEFAAAAGRVAIPGARAVRLVNLFKKTAPTLFDTTESAAEQVSFTYRNALNSFLSRNLQDIRPDYAEALAAGDVNTATNILREFNSQLDAFQSEFKDSLLKGVMSEDPSLLKEETQARLINSMNEEELKKLKASLGGT